jgi:uncharacterized protein YggE
MTRSARLISIAITLALWMPAAAGAQTGPPTLHVVGHGRAFVQPDLATVSIVVTRSGATRELARGRVDRVANGIIGALVRIGIDRPSIQTSNVMLSSSTIRVGRHRYRTVWDAEIDLIVTTTRIGLLSPLFAVASRGGADSFQGPNFGFSDPSAGLSQATTAAVSDAQRRADAAATGLGMHVVGVQSVDLDPGSGSTPAPPVVAPPSGGSGRPPTTPVLPGRQEVDVAVDIVFLLGS